jgi:hypothetical protein
MNPLTSPLLTDLYQLNMIQAYLDRKILRATPRGAATELDLLCNGEGGRLAFPVLCSLRHEIRGRRGQISGLSHPSQAT